jgi:hypothetical protein
LVVKNNAYKFYVLSVDFKICILYKNEVWYLMCLASQL